MEWLNYHHLLYFWLAAREGGITRAAAQLKLAQPTVSAQIRALEEALGEKLFSRAGRNLVLTDVGRVVFRYAEDIFSLGRELLDTVKDRPTGHPLRLTVGVVDVMPKLVAYELLAPAFGLGSPIRVVCREGKAERLLVELAVHEIDVVLADRPCEPTFKVRAFNHLLGECGVTFLGTEALARTHRRRFPHSLDGAPFLLPTENTTLRRSLEQWFETHDVRPTMVSEFEDSALLMVFGQAGLGIFAAPSVIEAEIRRQFRVQRIGQTEDLQERFYAITVERRLKHPAVVAISDSARRKLFG
jgi:LysR family transcriptional regulator, transcriptional activator of nhaA